VLPKVSIAIRSLVKTCRQLLKREVVYVSVNGSMVRKCWFSNQESALIMYSIWSNFRHCFPATEPPGSTCVEALAATETLIKSRCVPY
jgi:hypothetical protein